ncbi:hypothetical protein JTB14_004628 [Gonioctena quinquepunctata]|nr:hypothetical protein JTB14_004628 [Gonioctena quinquepunctata]
MPEDSKARLVADSLKIMGEFNEKVEDAEKGLGHTLPALTQLENRLTAHFNANLHGVAHSSLSVTPATGPTPTAATSNSTSRMIPPHKWNIKKFSGEM